MKSAFIAVAVGPLLSNSNSNINNVDAAAVSRKRKSHFFILIILWLKQHTHRYMLMLLLFPQSPLCHCRRLGRTSACKSKLRCVFFIIFHEHDNILTQAKSTHCRGRTSGCKSKLRFFFIIFHEHDSILTQAKSTHFVADEHQVVSPSCAFFSSIFIGMTTY